MAGLRIGVDLGGTKIEAAALDGSGRVVARRRRPTPAEDYERTLAAVVELVDEVENETGGRGSIGVGIPGAISPKTGLVKNSNSTWLNGQPFDRDLARRLGRPVRVANDANCFAISEAVDGAAAGAKIVFGVILGTGVGGGIVIDGRVLEGADAIAGEWGHNPLPSPTDDERPGEICPCGRRGCIETWLSGPALVRDHERATGRRWTAAKIGEASAHGDAGAESAVARLEERLARALGHIVNILDPEAIVLGGGVSNIARLFRTVPLLIAPYVFSDRVVVRIVPARHGDSSGVRGAAWLWAE